MRFIKTFENYNSNITLLLIITSNEKEFENAIEFFNKKSIFQIYDTNGEFKSISFLCTDQQDTDATEIGITEELIANGFDNFRFEQE